MGSRPRIASGLLLGGALTALVALCVSRGGDLATALAAVDGQVLVACVLLHVATLVARSEAWRISLAAVDGHALDRRVVHGANAGAFVAGGLVAHGAMPVRVALLHRLGGDRAPRPWQIAVADVPLFALEVAGVAACLAVAAPFIPGAPPWLAPAALAIAGALLLAGRMALQRWADRPIARGLAVLGDVQLRARLTAWVTALTALGVLRVLVVLEACGLPAGPQDAALMFGVLGGFGLLPLGPAAPAGATLAVNGATVDASLAAGLVISGSTLAAVLVYAAGVAAVALVVDHRPVERRGTLHRRWRPSWRSTG